MRGRASYQLLVRRSPARLNRLSTSNLEHLTAMSAALLSITPLIPAGGHLADALVFYREHIGFSVVWQAGRMAGIERDGVSFNLVENSNSEWASNTSSASASPI